MASASWKILSNIFALLVSLVFYYISVSFEGAQFNYAALIFLIVVLLFQSSSFSEAWIFFLYMFGLVAAVFSSVFVESYSSYLVEIKEYAYPTGGASRNAFLASVFLCSAFLAFNISKSVFYRSLQRVSLVDAFAVKVFVVGGWALVVYMGAVVVIYGSPLAMGIDRFSYWASVAPSGYRYVVSLAPTFAFAISYAREAGVLRGSFAVGWLFIAIALLVLGGEKLSGLIVLVFFFFLPYFCVANRGLSARFIILGGGFLVACMIWVLVNYYLIYGGAFLEIFESRLALQGQMLFALDVISFNGWEGRGLGHFLGIGGAEGDSGIRHLMYLVGPASVVDHYLSGGATFTAPFPANMNYFFGRYGSPMAIVILGGMVGYSGWILYQALRDRVFLLGLLALKFFFYIYISVIMGEAYMLSDWKMAVYILFVILVILVGSSGKHERR